MIDYKLLVDEFLIEWDFDINYLEDKVTDWAAALRYDPEYKDIDAGILHDIIFRRLLVKSAETNSIIYKKPALREHILQRVRR